MNASQRVENAMVRAEQASADLLRQAFHYGRNERGTWDDERQAAAVQLAARKYAAAIRALARLAP